MTDYMNKQNLWKRICRKAELKKERIVWTKRILYPLFVLIIMAVIFRFSSQPAVESQAVSDGLLYRILDRVGDILPVFAVNFLNTYIRKIAHFIIYFLLGVFLACTVRAWITVESPVGAQYSEIWKLDAHRRRIRLSYIWLPLLIGVLYAVSDEVHQLFVPGRSGEVRDVILDSCGVACGIFAVLTILHFGDR